MSWKKAIKHQIVNEALNEIVAGLPAVSTTGTTQRPFTKPSTAEFLAEKSELCHQLVSTVGTLGSDYSYKRNGFLIRAAYIDGKVQKVVPRLLQVRLLHVYTYLPLPVRRADCKMYDICNERYAGLT